MMSTIQQQLQILLQQQKALNLAVTQCAAAIESQGENTNVDLGSLINGAMVKEIKLQDHTIATMPDHFKEQYVALLIHALKTATPLLSEAQYTLLGLLLRSMKLPQKSGAYFENNQEINSDFLLRFKKENTSDSATSFMMDLMLIARIPGNFSAQSLQLFSQLSELLGLTEKQLREIDEWCAYLLGLSGKVNLEKEEIKIRDVMKKSEFFMSAPPFVITHIQKGFINHPTTQLIRYNYPLPTLEYMATILEKRGTNSEEIPKDHSILPPSYPGYFKSKLNIDDPIKKKEEKDKKSSAGGFFSQTTSQRSSSIFFGDYYLLPHFALFWFSFIDFDALIQGQ